MTHAVLRFLILGVVVAAFAFAWVRSGQQEEFLSPTQVASAAQTPNAKSKTPQAAIQILSESNDSRLIKHASGETTVPRNPLRIASLSSPTTDALLALGITPIAVQDIQNQPIGPPPYLVERLQGVANVGRSGATDLELLYELKPDLIFIGSAADGRLYAQLSKIAPTVFMNSDGAGLQEQMILAVGEVVGKTKEAEARLDEFLRHAAEVKKEVAPKIGDAPVVFLRFRMQTCVIYSVTPMVGPVLFRLLGLTPDPMMSPQMPRGGWNVLNAEQITQLKAEHIFVGVDANSERYYEEFSRSPLWKELPAVKKGNVHRVSLKTWLSHGVLAYEQMLDDVRKAVNHEETDGGSRIGGEL